MGVRIPPLVPNLGIIMTIEDQYHELLSIALRIHYARIAMNNDGVVKGLDDIDKFIRDLSDEENFN